jgi:hypothetical protein
MIYDNSFVIIILCVDNFILVCNYLILLKMTKDNLMKFFEMVYLCEILLFGGHKWIVFNKTKWYV